MEGKTAYHRVYSFGYPWWLTDLRDRGISSGTLRSYLSIPDYYSFIFNGCLTLQMYWLGPLLGGILAGLLYDLVFATNASVEKAKAFFTKRDYDDSQFGESSAKIGAVE